jgi:2,4'-dihydroxyacetophenone dioxygenase
MPPAVANGVLHEHVGQLRIEGRRRWQHHASASEVTMIAQGAPKLEEILIQSESVAWREKSLKGVHEKMLWRNEETGASIALIKFDKGAGIPQPHSHASNQFMFCLKGRYEYTATGVVLSAGCFYANPKGHVHGPAIAHEETVVIEIYDGPHYPEKPSWYADERDAR